MHAVMRGNMRETGWSPIYCTRGFLRGVFPSTRGPGRVDLWSTSSAARWNAR